MTGQIERELRQFVVDNLLYGNDSNQFSDDDSFLDAGLIDSMSVVTLVAHIQERYAIHVVDEDLVPENLDSVSKLARFVQRKATANR